MRRLIIPGIVGEYNVCVCVRLIMQIFLKGYSSGCIALNQHLRDHHQHLSADLTCSSYTHQLDCLFRVVFLMLNVMQPSPAYVNRILSVSVFICTFIVEGT